LVTIAFAVVLLTIATIAESQSTTTEFDRVGEQPNRDYLKLQPFERLDSLSGNVVVTLPIFTLPGNAGRDLQFELTYNTNSGRSVLLPDNRLILAPWTFGVRGVPFRINDQAPPGSPISDNIEDTRGITPLIVMGDGAERGTMFRNIPNPNDPSSLKWFISSDVWKYNRTDHILYTPDGTTYRFDSTSGKLTNITDVFGNQVTFDWTVANQLTVGQVLGNGESRTVTFAMNVVDLPTTATYLDRVWQFAYDDSGTPDQNGGELRELAPPIGAHWFFTYETPPDIQTPGLRRMKTLKNPFGGTVTYTYEWRQLTQLEGREFLVGRTMSGITEGWSFNYAYSLSGGYSGRTVVDTPSAQLIYDYGPVNETHDQNWKLIDGGIGLLHAEVRPTGGTNPIQLEDRDYQRVPAIQSSPTRHYDAAALANVTLTRDNRVYTTDYTYDCSNPLLLGDCHRPSTVTERGEIGSDAPTLRTFTMTYAHPRLGDDENPTFVMGLMASQRLESNGEVWNRCWAYDNTGFKTSETEFGSSCASAIGTTFAPAMYGNIGSLTDGRGKQTTFTYSYGRLKNTGTPLYTISRVINPDGTVESETQADRKTSFMYDSLQRVLSVQPPGGTQPAITVYGTNTVQTTRGSSSVTTTLDNFGRPVATVNSLGVNRTMRYDAEGRLVYEGYPFLGPAGAGTCPSTGDVGTCIQYDALGRMTRRTNPDGTFKTYAYGPGTVTIADENHAAGRPETIQTWQAFGDPDTRRLIGLTDAIGTPWTYSYHAIGELASVVATDGTARTWMYNGQHRLATETHPESGTTTYSAYDLTGNLTTKSVAKGTTFTYTYDDNNRISTIAAGAQTTIITYEAGSDNRTSTADGTVTTTFAYDTAGRIRSRQDAIGAYVYSATFGYNTVDDVTSITYPTGRIVSYDADSEHQITHVYETAAGRDYASGMGYHPSGGLATYTAGNLIPTSITYDPQRYWVRTITSDALGLAYDNYDGVGNVRTIGDSRIGYAQTFAYDALDRLVTAAGPWGIATYPYDVHGNRQSANGTTYQYDAQHWWLMQQGTSAFGYDPDGNMISRPNANYTYTPEDWLATATIGGSTTTYSYDADGWRVRKSTATEDVYYIRGLKGELLTEWKNPGPTGHIRDYVYAGPRLIAAVDRDKSNTFTACGGNAKPDGSAHSLTVPTGGSATVSFEGSACRRVSLRLNVVTGNLGCFAWVRIRKAADNAEIANTSMCSDSVGWIDVVTLPISGLYNVVVTAAAGGSATVEVRIYDVVDVTTAVVPNTPAINVNFTTPGQNARLPFHGTGGNRLSAVSTIVSGSLALGSWFEVRQASNNALVGSGTSSESGAGLMNAVTLPATDDYVLIINPRQWYTANTTVRVYEFQDVTGTITPNDPTPVTMNLVVPGQMGWFTFSGTSGDRVSAFTWVTAGDFQVGWSTYLWDSTTNTLIGTSAGNSGVGAWTFIDGGTYPSITHTGSYVLNVRPAGTGTGTARLSASEYRNVATPITPNDPTPLPITLDRAGQNARLPFNGIAGDRVSSFVNVTSGGFGSPWNIEVRRASDNALVGSVAASSSSSFLDAITLPSTAGYLLIVDPSLNWTGSATVKLSEFLDSTGTIAINGSSQLASPSFQGQNARFTFNGTAGQLVTVRLSGHTIGLTTVSLLKPGGATQTSVTSSQNAFTLTQQTLATTGVYTVLIDPASTRTGNITVAVTSP